MSVFLIPAPLTRINNSSFFGIGTTMSFFYLSFSIPQWHQGLTALDSVKGSRKKD
jgi:hypothetical protein